MLDQDDGDHSDVRDAFSAITGRDALNNEAEALYLKAWDLEQRAMALPARTLEGLRAKAAVAKMGSPDTWENDQDQDYPERWFKTFADELLSLIPAGGAHG